MARRSLTSVLSLVLVSASLAAPASGVDYPVAGTQLTLRERNNKATLNLILRNAAIPVPAKGSGDDPSLAGFFVTLFSRVTGERAEYGSVPSSWKVRTTPHATTYSYANRTATRFGGDIQTASMRTGSGLKVRSPAYGLDLTVPPVGPVAVRVQYGSVRVCAIFDGASVQTDANGVFKARNADAPGITDCDDETLAGIACPCWTSASLDAEFPAGYFDDAGRGGVACGPTFGFPVQRIAADTCTLPGPLGNDLELPRGGAAVLESSCALFDDADPGNTGVCGHPPAVQGVTIPQRQACLETLYASTMYRSSSCP
jgi:hypothetical protein